MKISTNLQRKERHKRLRKRVFGTAEKPRLFIFRTGKHLYAQAIDDYQGKTLFSFSTLDKEFKKSSPKGNTVQAAKKLGEIAGPKFLAKGVKRIVFDRGGDKYHGRVKALAEALRQTGVTF